MSASNTSGRRRWDPWPCWGSIWHVSHFTDQNFRQYLTICFTNWFRFSFISLAIYNLITVNTEKHCLYKWSILVSGGAICTCACLHVLCLCGLHCCYLVMVALWNRADHYPVVSLWSPYVIGQTIIFSSCFLFFFLLLSSFFFFLA